MSSKIFEIYDRLNISLCSVKITAFLNQKNEIQKQLQFPTDWINKPKFNRKTDNQIVMLTGKKSNVSVIDIDDPNTPQNKELIELCNKQCNFIQQTRKGFHFIFKYTDKLHTTTNSKKALDCRNDGGALIVEPTTYEFNEDTYRYYFIKKPKPDEEINPINDEILKKYFEIIGHKEDDKSKIKTKETIKQSTKELKHLEVNKTISTEDAKFILDNLNVERFDNYHDWILLGILLKKYNIDVNIYEEYSKKSNKYIENEPYNFYMGFDVEKYEDLTISTLYYWLKMDNKEKFNELMNKGKDDYQRIKLEIEKKYFLVGSKFYKKLDNRQGFEILNESDVKIQLKPEQIEIFNPEKNKMVKTDFYSKWIVDKKRAFYDKTDFIPNKDECPDNIYNLFDGFNAEQYLPLIKTFTLEQIDKKIKPFLDHINILTNNDPDYFIKWLAHIIQFPHIKEGTTPLFRDKGNFLTSGGGTGKNLFLDNYGKKVLGEKYYLTIGTNNELYNSFNEHLENKLLVVIEEAQGKSNFENFDRLKSTITQSQTLINRKGIPKYTINDYSRYIFCSNNENPIPIDNNDRRFFCYDVSTKHRNDTNYFKKLDEAFNDKEAIACLFTYLKTYKTYESPIDYQINRPINKTYIEMKRINAPSIIKWIISLVKNPSETILNEKVAITALFNHFNDWTETTRNKKNDITLNSFSRFLTADSEVFTSNEINKVKSSTMKIHLKLDKIKEKLIEKNYFNADVEFNIID